MRAYDFHPEAESDINAIWDYIAEDRPDAADRTIDAIVAAIEALVPLPHLGHRRPDLTSRPLRFITAQNYLIAYAPDQKTLMGGRRYAWTLQPPLDGLDPQGQRVTARLKYVPL